MPAFFTHYAIGVKNYKKLHDGALKRIIKEHKNAYSLGTIGPDIFFYYFPDMRFHEKKPGNVMHEKHSQRFFENMLKRAELFSKKNQKIAYAYVAGFIGHYELDVHCHPFVYEETEAMKRYSRYAEHFALENAMDVFCCYEYLHRLPSELNQRAMIKLTLREKRVISTLLADAYCATYHEPKQTRFRITLILNVMRLVIFALEDKSGRKEHLWKKLETTLFGHVVTTPLFINNNTYMYDIGDWYIFEEFVKEAFTEYKSIMPYLEQYVVKRGDKRQVRRVLLDKLGNHSYHEGKVY